MTHRILLADDSLTIRKVVELTFSEEDFTIDSVGDGATAFEHARARRPDIIISDVIMPGLNGYELCQQVKTDPSLQSVPFLFLKGAFESFDEEKARSCGADGFIAKPFESQEMVAKVRNLIERSVPAAPVAARPAPVAAAVQPAVAQGVPAGAPRPIPAAPAAAAIPPAAPRPVFAPPGPAPQHSAAVAPPSLQQRPGTAPPPLPGLQSRPAAAAPAIPIMPARPAPPIPPRPMSPGAVTPPSAHPPLRPTPPIHVPPPPPLQPTPPIHVPPQPATQAPSDDFGFDFGETESDRFGVPGTQSPAHIATAAQPEPPGESDEDLWSEVSLRGSTSDLFEDRTPAGSGADIVRLAEESAIDAPEVLFDDETEFEPPVEREEIPVTTASVPTPAPEPSAPITIDQAEIERIVASRVEAAVRQVLEPIVNELARTMIEAVAWEVIPDLAEAMIRAEIERVRQSTRTN